MSIERKEGGIRFNGGSKEAPGLIAFAIATMLEEDRDPNTPAKRLALRPRSEYLILTEDDEEHSPTDERVRGPVPETSVYADLNALANGSPGIVGLTVTEECADLIADTLGAAGERISRITREHNDGVESRTTAAMVALRETIMKEREPQLATA